MLVQKLSHSECKQHSHLKHCHNVIITLKTNIRSLETFKASKADISKMCNTTVETSLFSTILLGKKETFCHLGITLNCHLAEADVKMCGALIRFMMCSVGNIP
jgi:hypothetical protein